MLLAWEYMFLFLIVWKLKLRVTVMPWLKIPVPAACPPNEPGTDLLSLCSWL